MANLLAILVIALQVLSIQIHIDSSGVVTVSMDVDVTQGVNKIKLPVQPIVESIEVTVGNDILTPVYSNGTLYVFSPVNGTAHISYLANITTTNGVLEFDIVSKSLIKLVLSSNIILLSVPSNLVNFNYSNSNLILYLYGPQTIQYVVKKVVTTPSPAISTTTRTTSIISATTATTLRTMTNTTTRTRPTTSAPIATTTTIRASITSTMLATTVTTTRTTLTAPTTQISRIMTNTTRLTTSTTVARTVATTPITKSTRSTTTVAIVPLSTSTPTTSPTTTTRMQTTEISWFSGTVIAIVVGAVLAALVVLLRKRGGRPGSVATEALSDLDKAILTKLAEKGGSALQSELQKELGTPKTTLWRHIKKLEKLGYVEIVKEGTFNRIILKRKP